MPIPAVNSTDEDRPSLDGRSSAVDEAAIEWAYSPLIRACNTQLRRWQPTNVLIVNALVLTEKNRSKQATSIFGVLCLNRRASSLSHVV